MCTALSIQSNDGKIFFGRNMDLCYFFNQSPLIIPKNYQYHDNVTGNNTTINRAIIGMGTVINNHPAMAEAMNENGLACAGLNFAHNAYFDKTLKKGKINMAPYDFILWVLSNHATIEQVEKEIEQVELVDVPINENIPVPTLHWMITDKSGKSIVVEKTKSKLSVYQNPVSVMTNDPTFDWHLTNLNEYMKLDPRHPQEVAWEKAQLKGLGIGAGTLGMPGDFASVSRFVRIAYLRAHIPLLSSDIVAVTQFFHMLDYVQMVKGCVLTEDGQEDLTLYSSCMDLEEGFYYYKTYENNRLNVINMFNENLSGNKIKIFSYETEQDLNWVN